MYFQRVALITLLAALGVEGAAAKSSATSLAASSTTTSATTTKTLLPYSSIRPAAPTDFPEPGKWDLNHIKLGVDYESKKCLVKIENVYGCTGQAILGDFANGVCEPIWNKELPLIECAKSIGIILAQRGPDRVRFKNKYSQEVRWDVNANSPDMDDGIISWGIAELPTFNSNFPNGPNNNYW